MRVLSFFITKKEDGKYAYISECRRCFIVYKVAFNTCYSIYIVKSKNGLNKKIKNNTSNMWKKLQYTKKLNLFIAPFAQHFT